MMDVTSMLKAASAAAVAFIALSMQPVEAAESTEGAEIGIAKMRFEPQRLTIRAGTTVKWVNHEKRTNHSLLFEEEGLPESERLFPGESWQRSFDKPGTYRYRCGPHPEMTGEVEVLQ